MFGSARPPTSRSDQRSVGAPASVSAMSTPVAAASTTAAGSSTAALPEPVDDAALQRDADGRADGERAVDQAGDGVRAARFGEVEDDGQAEDARTAAARASTPAGAARRGGAQDGGVAGAPDMIRPRGADPKRWPHRSGRRRRVRTRNRTLRSVSLASDRLPSPFLPPQRSHVPTRRPPASHAEPAHPAIGALAFALAQTTLIPTLGS